LSDNARKVGLSATSIELPAGPATFCIVPRYRD
jgi:hypothetical protein